MRFSSFEKNIQEIHNYYMKVRSHDYLSNPMHDYPRLINKLTFAMYREMIHEYESNIKPQMLDTAAQDRLAALMTRYGLTVEYKTEEGFVSVARCDENHEYELRLTDFVDKLGSQLLEETQEEGKRLIEEPNSGTDERFFFKYGKGFVPPEAAYYYKDMLDEHVAKKKNIAANPFVKTAITQNLLGFEARVKNLRSGHYVVIKGSILD